MADEGQRQKRTARAAGNRSALDVCHAFEQAWDAGRPPSVESLLADVPAADRHALLFGLLRREISYRKSLGEVVTIDQYQTRFGDSPDLVAALFLQHDLLDSLLQRCGYELLERIESGRAGDVYRVLHREEQRLYAVKVIPAFLVRRSAADARQMLNLDYLVHPHISRPTELIEIDGHLLMFNEYVEGMNFGQLVEQLGVMPAGIACELIGQIAEGLQQLHDYGRTHGALTPTTLVVATRAEELGVAKLGSVGLTEVADLRLARFAHTALQTEYDWRLFAAPEVADEPTGTDPRSDLYSLGCTLSFLLSGERPQGTEACESKESIRVLWKRTALTQRQERMPGSLRGLIDRLMAVDPAERPGSVTEVKDLLRPLRDAVAYRQLIPQMTAAVARRERLAGGVRIAGPVTSSDKTAARISATDQGAAPAGDTSVASVAAGRPSSRHWIRPSLLIAGALALLGLSAILLIWLGRPNSDSVQASLAEYTGLAGVQWFDEIPWYTPYARLALIRRLQPIRGAEQDEIFAWAQATTQLDVPPDQQRRDLAALVRETLESAEGPEAQVTRALCDMEGQPQLTLADQHLEYERLARLLGQPKQASQFHLRALLRQACGESQQAAADFRAALELYREDHSCLLPLCASDFAQSLKRSPGTATDPIAVLQQEALPLARTTALQIYLYCAHAHALREQEERGPAAQQALERAKELAREAGIPSDHPLQCALLEEEARIALDQWRVDKAYGCFQQALELREQIASQQTCNPWRFVVPDVIGLSWAAHLMGDQSQAVELLSGLLAVIDTASLSESFAMSPRRASRLLAFRPQLLVQLGDIYLTGSDYDYEKASRHYRRAVACGHTAPSGIASQLSAHYKLVVALVFGGEVDEAAREFERAEQVYDRHCASWPDNGSTANGGKGVPRDVSRYRALAESAVALRSSDSLTSANSLRSLETLACSPPTGARTIPTRLLAGQLLLESPRCQPASAARTVASLAQLVQQCSQHLDDTEQGFFQRFVRTARFAALSAKESLEGADDTRQLAASLLVLDKAHRVFVAQPQSGPAERISPESRLHTMCVGVSRYQAHSDRQPLNLVSAHRDAAALDRAFDCLRRSDDAGGANPIGLYGRSPLSRVLTDQEASRAAILQFVEDLRALPAAQLRDDLVIITLSGHGLQDLDGSLFFLPADYRPGSLLSSGLSIDLFQSKLRMLGANVLLIIDTCYSGAARRDAEVSVITRATDADVQTALRRMTDAETALAVLVAGRAREKAGESQLFGGHGALTAAVLEFVTQRQFNVATKNQVRPTPLNGGAPDKLLTLEDLRRYVVDRVAQFPMIEQRPSLYTTGRRIGNYSCGDIPLRFVRSASESDEEAGTP
jgi:serine/threonine-protein kinase